MSLENPNNLRLLYGLKRDPARDSFIMPEPIEEPEVEEESEVIDLDSRRYRKYLRDFNRLPSVLDADVMWRHTEGQSLSDIAWDLDIRYDEAEKIRGDGLAELGKIRAKNR